MEGEHGRGGRKGASGKGIRVCVQRRAGTCRSGDAGREGEERSSGEGPVALIARMGLLARVSCTWIRLN